MVAYPRIYDSLADLMVSMDAAKVLAFHAPEEIQMRVEFLLQKKSEKGLSAAENQELEHYFILEHIVRLAKSRAQLKIKTAIA